jgi:O-acetyl-ADP-ribose deacetylase (regulator of RNase III)
MNATFERVEGDITRLSVDAIVNAANERLAPGGGVCGAIHRAAGPRLAEACAEIGRCPTGEARITPGFDLSAGYVIHAVGPVWHGGTRGEQDLLAGCYRYSIDLARHYQCRSIAFPAISTGIFGYPPEAASRVAVATVRAAAANGVLPARVLFVCFGKEMMSIYGKLLDGALAETSGR